MLVAVLTTVFEIFIHGLRRLVLHYPKRLSYNKEPDQMQVVEHQAITDL